MRSRRISTRELRFRVAVANTSALSRCFSEKVQTMPPKRSKAHKRQRSPDTKECGENYVETLAHEQVANNLQFLCSFCKTTVANSGSSVPPHRCYSCGCTICGLRSVPNDFSHPRSEITTMLCDSCGCSTHAACAGLVVGEDVAEHRFDCSPICLWDAQIVSNPFFDDELSQQCNDETLSRTHQWQNYFYLDQGVRPALCPFPAEWLSSDHRLLQELLSPSGQASVLANVVVTQQGAFHSTPGNGLQNSRTPTPPPMSAASQLGKGCVPPPIGSLLVRPKEKLLIDQCNSWERQGPPVSRGVEHSWKRQLILLRDEWCTAPMLEEIPLSVLKRRVVGSLV